MDRPQPPKPNIMRWFWGTCGASFWQIYAGFEIGLAFSSHFILNHSFCHASGEEMLGTQPCFSKTIFLAPPRGDFKYTRLLCKECFLIQFVSCLRRGDFRFTTILFKEHVFFVRASDEEILVTQRFLSKSIFSFNLVRASGIAVLGTVHSFYVSFYVNNTPVRYVRSPWTPPHPPTLKEF